MTYVLLSCSCLTTVCKPCLDNWLLFESSCYLFSESNYSSHWMTWQESRNKCRNKTADLVVIESHKEQVTNDLLNDIFIEL